MHFNLDKSLTQYDVDAENCNVVDNSSPIDSSSNSGRCSESTKFIT